MPKQMITSQTPGGKTSQVEVELPAIKATPDPTYDATKDYAPDPSRKNRTTFGVGEGDQS